MPGPDQPVPPHVAERMSKAYEEWERELVGKVDAAVEKAADITRRVVNSHVPRATAAAYKARIVAALDDRDGREILRSDYITVLEAVADRVDQMLSDARANQEFEDAQTPVQGEDEG